MEASDKIISGVSHCCHHNVHYEWCTDYQERFEYIKKHKPENEQALRQHLFQIIPIDRLSHSLREVWKVYDEEWKAYNEAGKVYSEAWKVYNEAGKIYNEAGKVYNETRRVSNDAWIAYNVAVKSLVEAGKAYKKAFLVYEPELAKLHDELFPDCTWNEERQSIF